MDDKRTKAELLNELDVMQGELNVAKQKAHELADRLAWVQQHAAGGEAEAWRCKYEDALAKALKFASRALKNRDSY